MSATEKTLKLTKKQIEVLREVRDGADIYSPVLAIALRQLERVRPALVSIVNAPVDSTGAKPFFGAICTGAGKAAIAAHDAKKGGRS